MTLPTLPYQPLEPDRESPPTVAVNIAPHPDIDFDQQPEFVSPTVAEAVFAARKTGAELFKNSGSAVHHVHATAVAQLLAAVPKEIADLKDEPDPKVREFFERRYRPLLAKNVHAAYQTLDSQLAKTEETHRAALDDLPTRRVSNQDIAWVNQQIPSWSIIPARYLEPILRTELITSTVRAGQFGRAMASLPVLRALLERPHSNLDAPEIRGLLREVEIVSRGPDWYQHQMGLMHARQARVKLESLARAVVETDGQLRKVPGIAARTVIYAHPSVPREMAHGFYSEFAGLDKLFDEAA